MHETKFNVNDNVRIRLTPRGYWVYMEAMRALSVKAFKVPDDDRALVLPLWEVMSIFGPHVHMGCVPLFATEIELLRETNK